MSARRPPIGALLAIGFLATLTLLAALGDRLWFVRSFDERVRVDELAAGGEDFDRPAVELAAWFHDGVYDGRDGAEERSALWALDALAGLPVAEEVARLVRLTERHAPSDDDANGCALSDADLAILAAAPERYTEYTADVRRRLDVRPGMTGLWQVSGRSNLSWEDSVRLDLYYVDNWSIVQDLVILARTMVAVVSARGAY